MFAPPKAAPVIVGALALACMTAVSQAAMVVHHLPFVPPASNAAQVGMVRVVNHSARAACVHVRAFDDTGERFGPACLWMRANQARQIDSRQLEALGDGKIGDGQGNWRLEFRTALDISALAYVRSPEHHLMSAVHDVVPLAGDRYAVAVFYPDAYRNHSMLRLVNPNDSDARVIIQARNDAGGDVRDEVRLVLPAGTARMLTAAQLETGGDDLEGRLGDAERRVRRLSVQANRPLWVMNLMQSPSGQLANLSSIPAVLAPEIEHAPFNDEAFFERVDGKKIVLRLGSDNTLELRFEFIDNIYLPFPRDVTLTLTSGDSAGYTDKGHWDYTKRSAVVGDRPNGATHVRVNGATHGC